GIRLRLAAARGRIPSLGLLAALARDRAHRERLAGREPASVHLPASPSRWDAVHRSGGDGVTEIARQHRWIEHGLVCPICKEEDVWLSGRGWRCASCREGGHITLFRERNQNHRKALGYPKLAATFGSRR